MVEIVEENGLASIINSFEDDKIQPKIVLSPADAGIVRVDSPNIAIRGENLEVIAELGDSKFAMSSVGEVTIKSVNVSNGSFSDRQSNGSVMPTNYIEQLEKLELRRSNSHKQILRPETRNYSQKIPKTNNPSQFNKRHSVGVKQINTFNPLNQQSPLNLKRSNEEEHESSETNSKHNQKVHSIPKLELGNNFHSKMGSLRKSSSRKPSNSGGGVTGTGTNNQHPIDSLEM